MSNTQYEPAFPVVSEIMGHCAGMSLRDYFEAHAPDVPPWWHGGQNNRMSDLVEWRVAYAKAMLEARSKE